MLDLQDQELFNRFRYRTLYSLGGSDVVDVYENHMLQASFTVSPSSPEIRSALTIYSTITFDLC